MPQHRQGQAGEPELYGVYYANRLAWQANLQTYFNTLACAGLKNWVDALGEGAICITYSMPLHIACFL